MSLQQRSETGSHGTPPDDRPALHRDGLSADARAARLPARQRLQDLHRLRRRHRVHAALDREVYGIPPEQVVGSSIKTSFEVRDGEPVLVRLPEIDFIDDKDGKPVGINSHIGRRPIAAFGNSDGDFQMLRVDHAGDGPRFGFWSTTPTPSANGPTTASRTSDARPRPGRGRAARLDVIDMKNDWRRIFP